MAAIKKKEALTVVEELLNKGVTESQIITFAGEWRRTDGNLQQPTNGNFQQGPGSSSNANSNNGYGGPSMNDLIRLNLLKGATSNMLNRMRTIH